jgi:hypothetical protein
MIIDPLSIQYPYSENTYWNQLPAYNANQGVDTMLDLVREIQQSGNYYYTGLVLPNLEMQPTVPALGTISGVIVVAPGAYIISIAGYCMSLDTTDLNAGFNLKIYDKGTKASVFYGDYAQSRTVCGSYGTAQDVPTGEFFLKEPFIMTGPGVLGWEVVNKCTTAATIQVLVNCAVPITNRSILNTVVNH